MFKLDHDRTSLYQWDTKVKVLIYGDDTNVNEVHFTNRFYRSPITMPVTKTESTAYVLIPDILLQKPTDIIMYAYVTNDDGSYTKYDLAFPVTPRPKPSDYVYTETETLTWKSLDERITELEKGGIVSTMTGATAETDGASGLVPQPKAGQNEKFLRGDGTWADVPQGGVGGTGNGDMQKTVYDPMGKATDVFAYAENTAESKVSAHNTESGSHSDIRELITGLTNRLNSLADSDDTTLDQLSEIVAYIKSNKSLIDSITTNKVSVSDIVDNLTSSATNKPLSAAQGKALKALIDGITIPSKLPNPNALTFTGAVTGSYDGSSAVTVNIPSGGGSGGTIGYPVISMTASTAALTPNTYYRWGEIAALTVTLADSSDTGVTNEYCFEFVSGVTATTLSVPDTVKWVKEPNVEAGKTYQVSILNGIGVICGA